MLSKNFLLLVVGFTFTTAVAAQKLKFANRERVYINSSANSNYRVRYINPKTDTVVRIENVLFNASGDTLSYQRLAKPNYDAAKILDSQYAAQNGYQLPALLNLKNYIYADIKGGEGKILIHPWFYSVPKDTSNLTQKQRQRLEANKFFESNEFYIPVERFVNLGMNKRNRHAGALTLPIKAYLGAPDSISAVQSAVSVGLYYGWSLGNKHHTNRPTEKEIQSYERGYSFNILAGVNKLDLDDKNTSDDGKRFKGSVTSVSYGVSLGVHYKIFSAFLAAGMDSPLSRKAKNWSLKNRPWIGFGAGFEIF